MIARSLNANSYQYEADVVTVDMSLTMANNTAPVIIRGSRAVSSLGWTSEGLYTVVLRDSFSTFLGACFTFIDSTGLVFAPSISVVSYNTSTKTLTFVHNTAASTPADLIGVLNINLRMGASSVNLG